MKLDLILENIRNKYTLGLLQESDEVMDEKQLLQSKQFINESTMTIRKILIENGLLEDTKIILENALIKAGAIGAAGKGVHLGAKMLKNKIDDGESVLGAVGQTVAKHTNSLNKMAESVQ